MICEYLRTWSAQQVFDRVAERLLTQGERSMGPTGRCAYRADYSNNRCAAGWLISDDDYDERIEGTSWTGLVTDKIAVRDHCHLIRQLQTMHDERPPYAWRSKLKYIATAHGLMFDGDEPVEVESVKVEPETELCLVEA